MGKRKIRLTEKETKFLEEENIFFINNTWFIIKDRVGDKLVLKEAKSASDIKEHMSEITAKILEKVTKLYFHDQGNFSTKLSTRSKDDIDLIHLWDPHDSKRQLPLEEIAQRSVSQMIHRAMATSETEHFNITGPKYNIFKFNLVDCIYQKEFGGEFSNEAIFDNAKVADELLPLLFDTFETTINMINWLDSPLQALDFLKPSEAIFINKVDDVIDELYRLKDGVYI